jgi:hypothetical protein
MLPKERSTESGRSVNRLEFSIGYNHVKYVSETHDLIHSTNTDIEKRIALLNRDSFYEEKTHRIRGFDFSNRTIRNIYLKSIRHIFIF